MASMTTHTLCALACASVSSVASAQMYSNTLGSPGLSGSYAVDYEPWDDGSGESLYITGQFSIAGVPGSSNIARWDGSDWQPVGGGLNGNYSNAIKVFDGDLIAAGYFADAGGVAGTEKLARWDGTSWHSMDAQSASFLNSMWDLEVFDDGITGEQLYIAGNYVALNGQAGLDHIAKWDGTAYTPVGGTIGGAVPLIVLDLYQADLGSGNTLYAGGRFLTIDGVPALNIAAWDGTSWSDLDTGITRPTGIAQVLTMVSWDDGSGEALYVGGRFEIAGGATVSRNIAKWDGSSWSSMGAGFDADVQELTVFDDGSGEALYAMGNFQFTNDRLTRVNRIAKWNGSSWEPVENGANDTVFGAEVYDYGEGEALLFAGSFTALSGQSSGKVGAYVADSSCSADLNGDTSADFFDISFLLNNEVDYNGDTAFDFFDISAFLQDVGAGCP